MADSIQRRDKIKRTPPRAVEAAQSSSGEEKGQVKEVQKGREVNMEIEIEDFRQEDNTQGKQERSKRLLSESPESGSQAKESGNKKNRRDTKTDTQNKPLEGEESTAEDAEEVQRANKRNPKRKETQELEDSSEDSDEESTEENVEYDEVILQNCKKLETILMNATKVKGKALSESHRCGMKQCILNVIEATKRLTKEHIYLQGLVEGSKRMAAQYTQALDLKLDKILELKQREVPQETQCNIPAVGNYARAASGMLREKRKVILAFPKEGSAAKTSQDLSKALKKEVDPKTSGLRVMRVTNIKNAGVAIELHPDEKLEKAEEILNKCANTRQPKKSLPKIIIYDVPTEYTPVTLTEDIFEQNIKNMEWADFEKSFKPVFKTGPRGKETTNWVIEVTGKLYRDLLQDQRIFLHWEALKCKEFLSILRCYKCQRFGHMAKDCRATGPTCGYCANTGHTYENCMSKDPQPTCAVCKAGNKRANHDGRSSECPTYIQEQQRKRQTISYE